MRIGCIQTLPVRLDRGANLRAVEAALQGAGTGADLWVLPELFSSGYLFCGRAELASVAEPADGPATRRLAELARRFDTAFVAGIPEIEGSSVFNSAVAVDVSGLRGVYRKTHLFDLEKTWFDPGDGGFPVIEMAGARIGIMICFDWRFPESARTLALGGAQIIAHPSNLVLKTCQAAMVTRALENGVYTVTSNRIGSESVAGRHAAFTGRSRIVGPDGVVLADAPADRTDAISVEIDPARADDKAVTARNDLFGDRRPGVYRLN